MSVLMKSSRYYTAHTSVNEPTMRACPLGHGLRLDEDWQEYFDECVDGRSARRARCSEGKCCRGLAVSKGLDVNAAALSITLQHCLIHCPAPEPE